MTKLLNTGHTGGRPTVFGRHGVVSSGHYLASEIGGWILRRGGNAADAAAAMGFALALLKPHQNGIAGEAPTLVRSAADGQVHAINGHGPAPAAATLEFFRSLGIDRIPGDGFLPAIVPPMVDTYLTLLARFGTMRLADVLGPAVALASGGFAMYDSLAASIAASEPRFREEWPTSAAVFLPRTFSLEGRGQGEGGACPQPGELFRNPDWADTMQLLIDAADVHPDRQAGLAAASDVFYRGPIAQRICEFARTTPVRDASGRSHTALLTVDDFAAYHAVIEPPVSTEYRAWRVYKCGPWTQGPAMLQTLNLLEGFDLAAMGHNSPDYIHTVVEAMKLAYADREFYYGDPGCEERTGDGATGRRGKGGSDLDRLLSKTYAAERRSLIDPNTASRQLRPGGRPAIHADSVLGVEAAWTSGGDTTKLEAIDAAGNVVSITCSGGWLRTSPVIPGLGFPLGTRGQMFSLEANHPNCVGPGKRPRSTLTPGIAIGNGALDIGHWALDKKQMPTPENQSPMPNNQCPFLAFGSPGGDAQDQWALQFFLNLVEFGMGLQQAVEAPTFWSEHWPNSFYPRSCRPGSLLVEGRIAEQVRQALASRGHDLFVQGDWSGGNTLAAMLDGQTGLLAAAASPRLDPAYAIGF